MRYLLPSAPCDRCGQPAPRFSSADRVAVDLDLDQPTALLVTVGVHLCTVCRHYFRCQPPFLRPDGCYTNRVIATAVAAATRDGMALRRVPERLARDFWVRPSERSIRRWCRAYRAGFDFPADYQPWVVAEFSGILCVDELYQGELALLLAVDPAAPEGDRLVGYQLTREPVDAATVDAFLERLGAAGIHPAEVITDGSPLYPAVVAKVWPTAAHQLCLVHESRRLTRAALDVINRVRKELPVPPARPRRQSGGPARSFPPTDDPADVTYQRWQARRAARQAGIAAVHELARCGNSQRAIARQLGLNRRTVHTWLQLPPPTEAGAERTATWRELRLPDEATQRRQSRDERWAAIQELAAAGLSYTAIAAEVGLHRVTVSTWLRHGPPRHGPASATLACVEPPCAVPAAGNDAAPPPAPWTSWEEVRQVRDALRAHRFLLVRRTEHLNPEQQTEVDALLSGPAGSALGVARRFLEEWFALWHTPEGQRRSMRDAEQRYQAWRTRPEYQALPPLRRLLATLTQERFARLGAFLGDPTWEATNNGAERAGRAFRHQQAPHFNLRTEPEIEGAILVAACQRKATITERVVPAAARSGRGRRPRTTPTCERLAA